MKAVGAQSSRSSGGLPLPWSPQRPTQLLRFYSFLNASHGSFTYFKKQDYN